MAPPNAVQVAYRGRGDTVGLNVNTWDFAQNTPWTQDVNTVFRVRFEIEETASKPDTVSGQLEASLNGGAFFNVTAASTIVRAVASAQFVDDAVLTSNLLTGSARAFVNGWGSHDGLGATIAINNQQTEIEFSVEIVGADVTNGDTITMRAAGCDVYSVTATITVNEVAGGPVTIEGAVEAVAELAGDASRSRAAGAAIEAVAELSGEITVVSPPIEIEGTIDLIAELAGDASRTRAAAASIEAVADLAGDITVTAPAGFSVTTRVSSTASDNTSHTVLLPNGSHIAGRRVVIAVAADGTGGISWPAGWTERGEQTTADTDLSIGERIIDGTEGFDGVDDSIIVTTATAEQSNHHAYLIVGAHASQALEVAFDTGLDASPNPPALDPAGWATEETLWIAAAALRFNGSFSAAPTNYTDLLSSSGGDTNAPLGTARRVASIASDNPTAFVQSGGTMQWVSATIAVRPAAAGGQVAIEGAVEAVAELAGDVIRTRDAAAAVEAVAELSGDITVAGQVTIEGAIEAVADLAGDVIRTRSAAGVIEAIGELVGDISIAGQVTITGAIEAVAEVAAAPIIAKAAAGTLEAVGEIVGEIVLSQLVAASIEAVAELAGDATVTGPITVTAEVDVVIGPTRLRAQATSGITRSRAQVDDIDATRLGADVAATRGRAKADAQATTRSRAAASLNGGTRNRAQVDDVEATRLGLEAQLTRV